VTVAGVLLAAGLSQRMGRPKALLPFRGETLLHHAVEALCATSCSPRIVVVSPEIEKGCWQMKDAGVALVVNADPLRGLASSIRQALEAIEGGAAYENVEGILITLVDQPLVTPEHLKAILSAGAATGLAATSWPTTFGPPVFLCRSFFPSLKKLRGDEGAKQILRSHLDSVRMVEFADAALDIDDPADYGRLLSGAKA
jgi:molybdenum cofactor cytidylyltransferase